MQTQPATKPDWISPKDRLPAEGQPVEISVLPNSPHVDVAKRLGDNWWVDRTYGGPYMMGEPAVPAYWRPIIRRQVASQQAQQQQANASTSRLEADLFEDAGRVARAELEALIAEAAPAPAMVPVSCQLWQAKARQTVRGGYVVHRRGDSSSKLMTGPHRLVFEHPNLDAAIAEAQRLAAKYNREFAVFGEITAVQAPAVVAAQQSEAA